MITITIKGIPKDTHRELKRRAAAHHRSLNREVIFLLESSVGDAVINVNQPQEFQSRSKNTGRISENSRAVGKFAKKK